MYLPVPGFDISFNRSYYWPIGHIIGPSDRLFVLCFHVSELHSFLHFRKKDKGGTWLESSGVNATGGFTMKLQSVNIKTKQLIVIPFYSFFVTCRYVRY